ncbi:GNAT family N-acetyltransferase, partial [Streptomyces sp. NPDC003233]
ATSRNNAASQRVLTKTGFVPVGPADPADLGGKPGTWHQLELGGRGADAVAGQLGAGSGE